MAHTAPIAPIEVHIRSLRQARKLSLRRLGTQTGIPFASLGRKERGENKWTIDELYRCAQALGVCLCQVLTLPHDHPTQKGDPHARYL